MAASDKASIEKRIVKLNGLVTKTNSLIIALADLYTCDKAKRLKTLTAAMKKLDSLRDEKVVGARKVIDACMNELTSLREGVFIGAVKKKSEFKIETCTTAISTFQEMIEASQRRLRKFEEQAAADAGLPVLTAAGEDLTEVNILKNLKEKSKLPAIKGKAYVVGRAPIVIVTTPGGASSSGVPGAKKVSFSHKGNPSNFVNRTVLEKNGFKVDNIDGYAILHDQLVLGVNKTMIELNKRGKAVETVREAGARLIESLSKVSKKKYIMVTAKPYSYDEGAWFWIMPEKEMNQFSKAFPGGHPKLNEWGFAF